MEDLATDNPTNAVTDNPPQAEPENVANGTGAPVGQATGAAPTDELFKGVDPNRLPPEIKSHYDSMLRDYRDKTARIAETIKTESAKATEAFKAKAEFYDQIATQDEFVKMWNEYVQKSQTQEPNTPGDPKLTQMEAKLQEMHQKMQMAELSETTDAFAAAVDEKGNKLHDQFDEFNSLPIGQLTTPNGPEEFSLLRACVELAPGKTPQEKLANGYKSAKQAYNSIFEAGKKAGMGRLQMKQMNGSIPPSNSGGEVMSVTDKKPRSAREAMDLARRGVVVSRD